MIQSLGIEIKDFKTQLTAGAVTAIVSFPLSIGFAILAGVPPIVMIAASIYTAFFNVVTSYYANILSLLRCKN